MLRIVHSSDVDLVPEPEGLSIHRYGAAEPAPSPQELLTELSLLDPDAQSMLSEDESWAMIGDAFDEAQRIADSYALRIVEHSQRGALQPDLVKDRPRPRLLQS